MFCHPLFLVTWHNIVITWSVARMKAITLKRSILLQTIIADSRRHSMTESNTFDRLLDSVVHIENVAQNACIF